MKKNNIGYLLREGVRGIFLHGFMSFAAIWVTVACLIIMGTFGLVLFNLNEMIVELEQENEMLVYIDDTYSEAEAKSVGSQINLIANVHSAQFISREEALASFVEEQQDVDLFAGLEASTFRDRFVVTLEDNSKMRQTEQDIRAIEGVADVTAHYEIAEGFQTVQQILNIASFIIIAVLLVVSMLIISNTVKLAMYDRKDEIAIMKMVGATNGFIRWPFVVEGFILGIVASALAFFLEWGLYNLLETQVAAVDSLNLITIVPFIEVVEIVAIGYAVVGFIVGVIGSLLSIRRFLQV
ncbi:MAG TPA: ABC transporter permease [Candidatus Avoscillospira avicola]|uniref:Cell division protein FtsX n=1 Tax=Candidatus Avoscillospira avicola TaxID=2840706 RepID=A0A9D1DHG4_9FIRM|nr:ABC transporter permease [Candidatus Avoscillospira avicola]